MSRVYGSLIVTGLSETRQHQEDGAEQNRIRIPAVAAAA
jgi:hypothetical protein